MHLADAYILKLTCCNLFVGSLSNFQQHINQIVTGKSRNTFTDKHCSLNINPKINSAFRLKIFCDYFTLVTTVATGERHILIISDVHISDLHAKAAEKHNKEQTIFLPTARFLSTLTHGIIFISMICRIVVTLRCAPTIVVFLSTL